MRKIKKKIPFVITHNPNNHNILGTAKRFFPILQQSENMKRLVKDTHIINSRRRAPNLKKLLTKARFSSNETKMVRKCGDLRCGTCEYIMEGDKLTLKSIYTLLLWKHWYMSFDVSRNAWNCLIFTQFCKHFLGENHQTPPFHTILIQNIYTPSVFCYDKHQKNFDIQFSLKRHETV